MIAHRQLWDTNLKPQSPPQNPQHSDSRCRKCPDADGRESRRETVYNYNTATADVESVPMQMNEESRRETVYNYNTATADVESVPMYM